MALNLYTGLFFLPSFWSGVRIPRLSSIGLSPAIVVFRISAISVATDVHRPIFSCSDLISSIPGLLLYSNLLIVSIISSAVTGFFIGVGLTPTRLCTRKMVAPH